MGDRAKGMRTVEHKLLLDVTQSAPAVRCVLLQAWVHAYVDEEPESGVEEYPILAIRTATYAVYDKEFDRGEYADRLPTIEAYDKEGWYFHGHIVVSEPLIVVPGGASESLQGSDILVWSEVFGYDRDSTRVVACPWTPQEDPERLASIREELRAEALVKFEKHPIRWKRPSPPQDLPSMHSAKQRVLPGGVREGEC